MTRGSGIKRISHAHRCQPSKRDVTATPQGISGLFAVPALRLVDGCLVVLKFHARARGSTFGVI
jgi:hypothetical protein